MTEPDGIPILAVDFDGTLCDSVYPDCGSPILPVLQAVQTRKKQGWKIILWTCRNGKALEDAVAWCAAHGLFFDAINDNLPEIKAAYGGDSRKVTATEYWDDRAVCMNKYTERQNNVE